MGFSWAGAPGSPASGTLNFIYSFTIPSGAPPLDTLTFVVPFTATAGFGSPPSMPPFDPQGFVLQMGNGSGLATINLHLSGYPTAPVYELQSAHFEFSAIPEPPGALFVGMGLVGLGVVRMNRTRQSRL